MPDDSNVTVRPSVRLARALTGTPLEQRPRKELEKIAEDAGVTPEGTGADGYVTQEDYVRALREAATATVTQRNRPQLEAGAIPPDTRTTEDSNADAD